MEEVFCKNDLKSKGGYKHMPFLPQPQYGMNCPANAPFVQDICAYRWKLTFLWQRSWKNMNSVVKHKRTRLRNLLAGETGRMASTTIWTKKPYQLCRAEKEALSLCIYSSGILQSYWLRLSFLAWLPANSRHPKCCLLYTSDAADE